MRYSFDNVASIRRNCSWDVYRNGVFQACVCTSDLEEKGGAEKLVADERGKSFAFQFHDVYSPFPIIAHVLHSLGKRRHNIFAVDVQNSLPSFAFESKEPNPDAKSQVNLLSAGPEAGFSPIQALK